MLPQPSWDYRQELFAESLDETAKSWRPASPGRLEWVKGLTIFIHFIDHLLQLLRGGVLAQHPHHLAQLLGTDAAILRTQDKDIEGSLELCVQW